MRTVETKNSSTVPFLKFPKDIFIDSSRSLTISIEGRERCLQMGRETEGFAMRWNQRRFSLFFFQMREREKPFSL